MGFLRSLKTFREQTQMTILEKLWYCWHCNSRRSNIATKEDVWKSHSGTLWPKWTHRVGSEEALKVVSQRRFHCRYGHNEPLCISRQAYSIKGFQVPLQNWKPQKDTGRVQKILSFSKKNNCYRRWQGWWMWRHKILRFLGTAENGRRTFNAAEPESESWTIWDISLIKNISIARWTFSEEWYKHPTT